MGSCVHHAHEPLLEIQPVIQDGRLRLMPPLFVAKREERVDPGRAVRAWRRQQLGRRIDP